MLALCMLNGCTDTEYAPKFSERAFNTIKIGDSSADVIATLGKPIRNVKGSSKMVYHYDKIKVDFLIGMDDRRVYEIRDPEEALEPESLNLIFTYDDMCKLLGKWSRVTYAKDLEYWCYSRSPIARSYQLREIWIDVTTDKVISKDARFYWD